jgi:putative heme transporter
MRHHVRTYLRHHWRGILNLVTIAAMLFLVYALRHQIIETLKNIAHVDYWVLLFIIPIQALSYDVHARMYKSILDHLGQPVSYRTMYRVTLELTFVNHAFPSGGISGISYFGLRLKQFGVRTGTATLLQLMRFILLFISFQVLVAIGLFALAIGGKSNNLMILVGGVLATLTLVATLLMGYIVGSKERINNFFTSLTKGLNRIIQVVRPNYPETISIAKVQILFTEMHESFMALKANVSLLRSSFFYALAANVCEILTIYIVFIAFGEWVNIGAVILAYAIANVAGLISVLPGGVGIYEVLMTAVMAAAGVPAGLSIPIIVMYRVLSMTVQLLPGWFLYHQAISGNNNER